MTTAVLLLAGLVTATSWRLRRMSPLSASTSPAQAGRRASTQQDSSAAERVTRTAWRATLLLGVLLLALAWAMGQVIDEARVYAEVHGMRSGDGEPARTHRGVVLACSAVLLVGALLLRSSLAARRREA
jgi:hypothetical protein